MAGYLSYMKGFERPGDRTENASPFRNNNWTSPGGIKMQDIRTSTGGQLVGRIYTWPDGRKEARDLLGAVKGYYMPGPDLTYDQRTHHSVSQGDTLISFLLNPGTGTRPY